MEIIKFNPVANDPLRLQNAEIIDGLKTKMWIERYREPGEFELTAPTDGEAWKKLPIGTYISHIDTNEVMVVENHEIRNDKKGEATEVVISGSSLETLLNHRIVGGNITSSNNSYMIRWLMTSALTWTQIKNLIDHHILIQNVVDFNDYLPNVAVTTSVTGSGTSEVRIIELGPLLDRVTELMEVDNLGIRTIRPNPNSPLGAATTSVAFDIYRGIDRSSSVSFNYFNSEIDSADYFWSDKDHKTDCVVTGRWVTARLGGSTSTFDKRKIMHVRAEHVDGHYTSPPTGTDLANTGLALRLYGLMILLRKRMISIVRPQLAKDSLTQKYRTHYNLGDIITVVGNYDVNAKLRVSEHVEIEDEKGELAYPTLILP